MPLDQQEIREGLRNAIGAHGIWKRRLRTAIAMGGPAPDPARTACPHRCQFGQWLAALPAAQVAAPEATRVMHSHAAFHKAAGAVAALVVAGRKTEAEADLDRGGFHHASEDLADALADWLRRT